MRLTIKNTDLDFDFVYSEKIYTGWYEGRPGLDNNEKVINRLKNKKELLLPKREDVPVHVIAPNVKTELLPGIAHIAWVIDNNDERHAVLIWFSQGKDTPAEALAKSLDFSTWKKVSKMFLW